MANSNVVPMRSESVWHVMQCNTTDAADNTVVKSFRSYQAATQFCENRWRRIGGDLFAGPHQRIYVIE